MINEQKTFAFSSDVKTRDNMVHLGNGNRRNLINIRLMCIDILPRFLLLDDMHPAT